MNLTYRSGAMIEDLAVNECTIRRTGREGGPVWWELWFYVTREDNGQLEDFAVPVIPRGSYTESGPGGRSWGLIDTGGGIWQVNPSINVLVNEDSTGKEVVAGPQTNRVSIWHQTPTIVGVPNGEPWQ